MTNDIIPLNNKVSTPRCAEGSTDNRVLILAKVALLKELPLPFAFKGSAGKISTCLARKPSAKFIEMSSEL